MGVRRVDKKDIKRIAKVTGAQALHVTAAFHYFFMGHGPSWTVGAGQVLLTLATVEGDEAFDASYAGSADEA